MKYRRFFATLVFTLVALLSVANASAESNTATPLKQLDGKSASIADYAGKGKWLVVMLWASDCMVCNREAPNYQAFHDKHKDKDAHILGVSLDGQAKLKDAKEFIKRHGVKFPNLVGEALDIANMYKELTGEDWTGTPTFMVYNPKGELLGAQVGAVPPNIIEGFIQRESAASAM